MNPAPGSILPQAYFDALSRLWGATAYVAGSLVAVGLLVSAWRSQSEPGRLIMLIAKVLLVGLATVFLREWLMRLNDIVMAFGNVFQIDPRAVDQKFIQFLSGSPTANSNVSAWDVIWNTKSIGAAIAYALLWLVGWMAWAVQFVVKLVGDVLLSSGWALSPLFLAFFMLPAMRGVALRYLLGLVALVCWPFGWVIAGVVTDALLHTAATASLVAVPIPGSDPAMPLITVALVAAWMLLTAFVAPYALYRILMSGANPAAALAESIGGVAQSTLVGGVGAATAAVTGGATVPVALAAAAVGASAAGTESAARGGKFPQTTAAAMAGATGLYRGQFARQQTSAMNDMASAEMRKAAASERFSAQFAEKTRQRPTEFPNQPHHPNPNQAALDIDSDAKS